MDDNTKTVLKLAAIGGGAMLLYWWLRSSGMWEQWFGGNVFTDQAKLLDYCRGNPLATAVFIAPNGARHEAPCSDWLRLNPAAEAAPVDLVNADLAALLRDAAIASPILGADQASVDQWNYLLREIDPVAVMIDNPEAVGVERGVSDIMSAAQFVMLRNQLLAKREVAAVRETQPDRGNPYQAGWVN